MRAKLLVAGLTRFAQERKLGASAFTVLALVGDIALQDGKPKLHAHVLLPASL